MINQQQQQKYLDLDSILIHDNDSAMSNKPLKLQSNLNI